MISFITITTWMAVIYLMVGIPYVAWLWFTDVPEQRYELPLSVIGDDALERETRVVIAVETVKTLAIAVWTWPWIMIGQWEDAKLRRHGKRAGGRHS